MRRQKISKLKDSINLTLITLLTTHRQNKRIMNDSYKKRCLLKVRTTGCDKLINELRTKHNDQPTSFFSTDCQL